MSETQELQRPLRQTKPPVQSVLLLHDLMQKPSSQAELLPQSASVLHNVHLASIQARPPEHSLVLAQALPEAG